MVMNVLESVVFPEYFPPPFLRGGHAQSVFPTLFRFAPIPAYERERISLPDGDFLDLDWARGDADRVVIVSHGLGGHSKRCYVTGMVRAFVANGWDAIAWNARGAGGEINDRPIFTHSGSNVDLSAVVEHVRSLGKYRSIALVGFSMGGNITLLYLARGGTSVPPEVIGGVAFSAPCDLLGASESITSAANGFYMRRFIKQLKEPLEALSVKFPDKISLRGYDEIKDFRDFDDRYTAPLHGYRDAADYWEQNSSARIIANIARPAWIVSALNDPFLNDACYPKAQADANPFTRLVTPESGGHCGFISFNKEKRYWSEKIAVLAMNAADNGDGSDGAGRRR
jgi:predicted alpha/beta-fold hydrolase